MNRDKVICPCYQVTKGDIADAVEQGAKKFKEVKKLTKAGKGCGKCKKKVKKLIDIIHDKNRKDPPPGEDRT